MLGFVLDAIFTLLAIRAIWKLLQGVMHGLSGQPGQSPQARQPRESGGVPAQGVQMARDPVCGTYVVPDRAVSITVGRQPVYFCSTECRDKYRAKTA
jgi:YHS domain-containing protein